MSTAREVAFLARALKAPRISALAVPLAERARSEGWDYEHYLAQVLSEEVASRETHGGNARVKAARFPQPRRKAGGLDVDDRKGHFVEGLAGPGRA